MTSYIRGTLELTTNSNNETSTLFRFTFRQLRALSQANRQIYMDSPY